MPQPQLNEDFTAYATIIRILQQQQVTITLTM